MLCIFCMMERPPSEEHVLPLALGGTLTTNRVCQACNSTLGSRVDAALIDFLPIRLRRAKLGLAGRRRPPSEFDILLGDHQLIGPSANRIRTTLDRRTGRLDHRQLYHAENVELPDGRKLRQVTIDARDRAEIPKIIQRERKRHRLPPLPEDELTAAAQRFTIETVENPLVQVNVPINFAYLRHAMMKVAYELAFLWLGEGYLADPLGRELRNAVCSEDMASTDKLAGYVGGAEQCTAFQFWKAHEAHHLAFATVLPEAILVAVRVFDIFAVAVPVSNEPMRHIRSAPDRKKLRFIAIDAVSGRTVNTTLETEHGRIALAMITHRSMPPFPDPLSVSP